MAASRTRNRSARWLVAAVAGPLAAGLLGTDAHALTTASCANPEIVVEAKPVEISYRDNSTVLRDVTIRQCDNRIEAAEARSTGGIAFENSRWTFSGKVRIQASGGNLSSDKAVVEFRNNLISEAVVTGVPAEFEQRNEDGKTSKGHANTIAYEALGGRISLRENAWLSDGCNEITGKQLVYNIVQQKVEGQSRTTTTTPAGDGRIRITIQPKTAADTPGPCTKQAADKKP